MSASLRLVVLHHRHERLALVLDHLRACLLLAARDRRDQHGLPLLSHVRVDALNTPSIDQGHEAVDRLTDEVDLRVRAVDFCPPLLGDSEDSVDNLVGRPVQSSNIVSTISVMTRWSNGSLRSSRRRENLAWSLSSNMPKKKSTSPVTLSAMVACLPMEPRNIITWPSLGL